MNHSQDQIEPFDYSSGKEYMTRLKEILNLTTDGDLAHKFNIPKGTVSTWLRRDMTPFEITLRAHLATGVSLKWLLLGEGEAFESTDTPVDTSVCLIKETISNGALTDCGEIKFDHSLLKHYGLAPNKTKLIEEGVELMMINTEETNPTSGRYLIDVDGAVSINHIQRLPGKKLAMSFGSSSIEISESDIKVLGKVVMVMGKE